MIASLIVIPAKTGIQFFKSRVFSLRLCIFARNSFESFFSVYSVPSVAEQFYEC